MPIHLIFEGAELGGKSWIMSQVYDYLEPKYNKSKFVLDGCHWFNCDNGIFGTPSGKGVVNGYIKIFNELKNKNIIVEKLHISDTVNSRLHRQAEIDYKEEEKKLSELGFKIVLITFKSDMELVKKRIKDRLALYPHYERILQKPEWYIGQQAEYIKAVKLSKLPSLAVETDMLPSGEPIKKIINWLE